jgi:hypothetical protein
MRHLRLLIIAIATICVLALAAFAFVTRPEPQAAPADDDIIIKGGSLEIDCGRNHGEDCMGGNDNRNKPRHRKGGKIVRIEVKKSNGDTLGIFTKKKDFSDGKPRIVITYREPRPEDN